MTLNQVFTQDQYERQPGEFASGEASSVEADDLLRGIEKNIFARRCDLSRLGSWQKRGEESAKAGDTRGEERALEVAAEYTCRIAAIEAELAVQGLELARRFGKEAENVESCTF